jgi:hypothetical protein
LPFIIKHNYFLICFSGGWEVYEQEHRTKINDRKASGRLSGEPAIQTINHSRAAIEPGGNPARSPLKIKSMNLI